jgi:hypothetical protein
VTARGIGLLVAAASVACRPDTLSPQATVYYPDSNDAGIIPYRSGGQFAIGVRVAGLDQLVGTTHAQITLLPNTATLSGSSSQTLTMEGDDMGIVKGTTVMTWAPGGPVPLFVQVAGMSFEPAPVPLVVPSLGFDVLAKLDVGTSWIYPVCVESTTDDGMVALHLDGAVLASGAVSDTMLSLAPGPCQGVVSALQGTRSHVSFAAVPTAPNFRVTATLIIPQRSFAVEETVDAYTLPTMRFKTPDGPLHAAPLSIVELHLLVQRQEAPVPGITVSFQSVPQTTATSPVPTVATTDEQGEAVVHFQMPQNGSIRIEASIGAVRTGVDFSP